jgi:Rogdi leucine zipper containing protein
VLTPLVTLRNLLDQSLDCVDITRWTGDRHSAIFISSQLRLLHSLITEARHTLKGPPLPSPSDSWTADPLDPLTFTPPLPDSLGFSLTVHEASLVLSTRTLEPADAQPDIRSMFALAIGVQRRLEHDEVEQVFEYRGKEVRVREKIRVESADPSLLAAMAKLAALEHNVGMARKCLSIVMGEENEESSEKDGMYGKW